MEESEAKSEEQASVQNGRKNVQINSSFSGVPNEELINDIFQEGGTEHADDAVDYEDIDELADDVEGEKHRRLDAREVPKSVSPIPNQENMEKDAEKGFDDIFGSDNKGEEIENLGIEDNDLMYNNLENNENFLGEGDDLHHFDMGHVFEDNDQKQQTSEDTIHQKRTSSMEEDGKQIEKRERKLRKRQKLETIVKKLEGKRIRNNLIYYFPDFDRTKPYNNHLLFLVAPRYYSYLRPPISLKHNVKSLIPKKVSLDVDIDQKKLFKSKKPISHNLHGEKNVIRVALDEGQIVQEIQKNKELHKQNLMLLPYLNQDATNDDKFSNFAKDLVLAASFWDDDKIINADEDDTETKITQKLEKIPFTEECIPEDDENIFNGQISDDMIKLNMNDPNLLFVPGAKKEKNQGKAFIPHNDFLLDMKFNISNDKEYEVLKNNYVTKVRSQLSNLNIEHTSPAMRLQAPYYKVKLNKQESRSFHRPSFSVRPGTLINFSKLKQRKKKKDRGKSTHDLFGKSSDLTLSDSGTLVGMEYAEEYPQILSNFGMGSKLINYYRKEKDDDNSRPKAQLGETHVLGVEDKSPFWNYGFVEKGNFVPTLYNNMIRAPVFKQDENKTTFLLLRSQGAGSHQRYFLRNIDHLFTVGQTFPAVEVPAPHSRKVTNTSKNRLKMIIFRVMNMHNESRIAVKDFSHHFPDQNDMQNRQRLKEFMEYQRQGEDQGYWKIKNTDVVPSEDEIKSLITPEDVALLDSMQHGQQALDDLIYMSGTDPRKEEGKTRKKSDLEQEKTERKEEEKKGKTKNKEKDSDRDKDVVEADVEEELAPWNTTRNFVNANQTKTMLQLNGEGDPTGIGLGFSFLRATQKNTFSPLFAPAVENIPKNSTATYHQKLYEEEIARIWYAQRHSLTVENQESHSLKDIYEEYLPANHMNVVGNKTRRERDFLLDEETGSTDNKVLRITRMFRDENNVVQRSVESVSDPHLIRAYLKRKKQNEDEMLNNAEVNDLIPTNDKELNKIRRRALEEKLASLEKKAKLGRGRKFSKDSLQSALKAGGTLVDPNTVQLPDGSYTVGGKGVGKGKSKTRRCASCGAYGHIKSLRSCPFFSQGNHDEQMVEGESPQSPATPTSQM